MTRSVFPAQPKPLRDVAKGVTDDPGQDRNVVFGGDPYVRILHETLAPAVKLYCRNGSFSNISSAITPSQIFVTGPVIVAKKPSWNRM